MSKWLGSSSQDETNKIVLFNKNALSTKLSDFGIPNDSIYLFLESCDASHLFNYCQEPESKNQIMELLDSLAPFLQSAETGGQAQVDIPRREQNVHEANRRANDLIMECSEQLRLHYMDCSNVLKVPLRPSTTDKIHNVEDMHVPVVLRKSEISSDLPQMADIQAIDFFQKPHFTKKRILLFGPHGVGKTTEIKMWLHNWCRKRSGPLHFPLVFYIDGAKLEQGTSLGEAVTNQCLPGKTAFEPKDIESMCQECQDEILVILDNYPQWKQTDRLNKTSSLEDMVLLRNFPLLTLLVATTSGGVGHFREVYGNYDHVQVEGISERSVSTYIYNVFRKRKEFGSKVERYLSDTDQIGNMAASPVLLSIMCQIVKWYDTPTLLGDLKTVSALMDKFIDCIIRHAEDGDSNITQEKSNADHLDTGAEEPSAMAALPLSSREQMRSKGPTTLRSQSGCQETSLSKDETIKQLSAVAFSCYLEEDHQEKIHLSEGDFRDVCGGLATKVIKGGCSRGLLVKSSIDEINPSSQKAAEGKVIRFLSPPFQQRLAAKHFAKLHQGNHEENQVFRNSLQKIGSIENALSLRNMLLFACGESKKTARFIIGHVVALTSTYARDMYPNPRQDEEVLRQAHGLYQYMIEFILDLNYEARSDGRLNDILGPLVTQLRILSPSDIMTRSLAYLLEHAATPNTPKLEEVDIEVFDVPREIQDSLPHHKSILYNYDEDAPVSIEMSAFEDLSAGGAAAASLPQSSLMSTTKRRLSIKVNQERTKGNKRCTLAPKFPPASTQVFEEDMAFPFRPSSTSSPTNKVAQTDTHHMTQAANVRQPVQESTPPKEEIEEIVDRSLYSIDESKCISFGGYGRVYEGKWKGKSVAVKRVDKVEKSMTKSLEREIKINALVDHPNIVKLHAYSKFQPGTTSDLCFDLIMELIDGFTLNDAVFENKLEYLQTDRGKLTTAMKVSDAIAHIHAKGCTHSDIKSDNILIRKSDNEPFVCDLGLGHGVTRSKITSSGRRDVIPKWAPPASFDPGYVATYEGDVWSLACVLLELFTGHRLWENIARVGNEHGQELSINEILTRFLRGNVTPDIISLVNIEAVRDALQSCFTKNKQKRPSARNLTEIFEEERKKALSSVNE